MALLPVFVLAVPLVAVAVTGRFIHVAIAGAALAVLGVIAGSWERRQREDVSS